MSANEAHDLSASDTNRGTAIVGRLENSMNFVGDILAGHSSSAKLHTLSKNICILVYSSLTFILCSRDVKTPKFFGPARPVVHFSGPARNTIFNFRPVWARLGPRQNLLS